MIAKIIKAEEPTGPIGDFSSPEFYEVYGRYSGATMFTFIDLQEAVDFVLRYNLPALVRKIVW